MVTSCLSLLERRHKARLRKVQHFEVGVLYSKSDVSNRPVVMIIDTGQIIRLAFMSKMISWPRLDPK